MAAALAVGTIALQLASAWHIHDVPIWTVAHYARIEHEHCLLCHVPIVLLPDLSDGGGDILPYHPIEDVDHLSVPFLHTAERYLQSRAPPTA